LEVHSSIKALLPLLLQTLVSGSGLFSQGYKILNNNKMGLIKETINHPTIDDVEITVDEHAKDETREPYDIVSLDISFSSISNPDELVELGEWLVKEGKRIKKQYTSTGKLRKGVVLA
jgi:hypothetical protein